MIEPEMLADSVSDGIIVGSVTFIGVFVLCFLANKLYPFCKTGKLLIIFSAVLSVVLTVGVEVGRLSQALVTQKLCESENFFKFVRGGPEYACKRFETTQATEEEKNAK
jgi:hypothetical protein